MRPEHKKRKVRKTDECIRRSLPGYFLIKNSCEWCGNAIYRGFWIICHHSKLERITDMLSLILRILFGVSKYHFIDHEICNSRNRKGYYVMGPTIDQYIVANCLYTIDEFNILYRGMG